MKKNFGPKTWFFPLPVLIISTYDEFGSPDAMNAAWGGIYDTNMISLCLDSSHKTARNIKLNQEFCVSFATKKLAKESDYFGIVSGNKEPLKIKKANLHIHKSENINAPIIDEYPVTLELKVSKLEDVDGTTYIIANIINVLASEEVLDSKGNIDTKKCEFITFNPVDNKYYVLGESVASAFKDGLSLK